MAAQIMQDNKVYNTVATELEKFYNTALDLVWKQIDPKEMKIITKQAKEADSKGNWLFKKLKLPIVTLIQILMPF